MQCRWLPTAHWNVIWIGLTLKFISEIKDLLHFGLGVSIRISTEHGNGSEITLAEQLTPEMLPSTTVSDPFFSIPIDEIGNKKLIIDVDAGDFVNECTEGNNKIVLDDVRCE